MSPAAARGPLCWSLVLGLATGCGADDEGRGAGPPVTTEIPDADAASMDAADATPMPADDCPEVRFEAPGLAVRACRDVGRVALAAAADAPPFLFVEVGTDGNGGPLDPASLPGQAWRSAADGVQVRWSGESGGAPLGGAGSDTDAALSLTIRVEGAAVLLRAALRWPSGARFPGPYRPVLRLTAAADGMAAEQASGQLLWADASGALVATPRPAAGPPLLVAAEGTRATFSVDADDGLLPGATWSLPEIDLDRGATPQDALAAWADRHGPLRPPTARWGWRSGPAYGALVSSTVLTDVARALPVVPGHPPPLIVADGRWFDRYGADAASPGFPDGLAAAAAAVRAAGGDLGLRWSPLATEASARCPTCGLDPREPMVREGAARRAFALVGAGARALLLELPPGPPPPVFLASLAAITGPRALLGSPASVDAYPLGAGDVLALGPVPVASTSDPCPEGTAQASQDARCAEALRALLGHGLSPANAAPSGPDATRTLATALNRTWPVSAAGRLLDPGPVLVGDGDEIEARRRATLAALAGGLYLLGDPPGALTPARLDLYLAPLRRGLVRWPAARPRRVLAAPADPPDVWVRAGQAVALFNDGPTTARWPSVAALTGAEPSARWVDVFSGQSVDARAAIEVPARDVRVLVAPTPDIE